MNQEGFAITCNKCGRNIITRDGDIMDYAWGINENRILKTINNKGILVYNKEEQGAYIQCICGNKIW